MRKIEEVTLKDGRNLKEVLESHYKWLEDEEDGKRANLSYEDLSCVNLSCLNLKYAFLINTDLTGADLAGVNLSCADLKGSNLKGANLTGVNLRGVNLIGADLRSVNLTGAYLSYANLTYANLISANLTGTDLTGADLTGANLREVYLSVSNLRGANLTDADLKYADLSGANLTGVNLKGVDLSGVKYNHITAFFSLQCPEEGSFVGYKKADNKIVRLLITEDAKRSSATTSKCRCSKAKVLSITSLDGKENFEKVTSDYDLNFVYEVGKIVEVKDFDDNRWNECAPGIHFFITRNEAVMY